LESTGGANSYVLVVFDSCRYDTFIEAGTPFCASLGEVKRRYSYASWTAPSHYNLLMGLMPHRSPSRVFASEVYKKEYREYTHRLGIDDVSFEDLVPSLWLPSFLRDRHGYRTHALVSLPVLNAFTPLAVGFDRYELMPQHNDMAAMLEKMVFEAGRPSFYLLNVGETHYPYALPGEPQGRWPRLSGVHGVVRDAAAARTEAFFEPDQLDELRGRQVEAVRYLDTVIERLLQIVPRGTWITVTSDHGELFGEDGYFGHGPILHDKVFEVPFVEGVVA